MTSLTIQLSKPTSEVKPIVISITCCPIRTQMLGGVMQEVSGFWKVIMMLWKTLPCFPESCLIGRSIRTDVFTYQSTRVTQSQIPQAHRVYFGGKPNAIN